MASVYLHIPFCQSRCIYCDFYSTTNLAKQTLYADCLATEMQIRSAEWPKDAHTLSIYIGGGTPSTLPPELLQRLFLTVVQLYPPTDDAEITIEANPDDVTEEWVKALKKTPVNRISMGVQTFQDSLLRTLRRRHDSNQAKRAVRLLQEEGYTNLSIDLIYGLPGQTLDMWKADIEQAILLGTPHISAYSLMYEEGTPITKMLEAGQIQEMDDELSWQCYEYLCKRLEEVGFEHYEISNFSLPGMHSRHNSAYWTGEAYLGFGAGAHSYDGKRTRRCNKDSLDKYLQNLRATSQRLGFDQAASTIPETSMGVKKNHEMARWQEADIAAKHPLETTENDSFYETETLSDEDLYNEFIMTRLRTAKGFGLEDLEKRFGQEALLHCLSMAKQHIQQGNLTLKEKQIQLTRQGVFVSNDVISDLFM